MNDEQWGDLCPSLAQLLARPWPCHRTRLFLAPFQEPDPVEEPDDTWQLIDEPDDTLSRDVQL